MTQAILSNEQITLRAVEVTDVDDMMRWENDSSQWDSANTAAPFSRKQLWDYAVSYDGDIFQTGAIRFIIVEKESGSSVGAVDIYDYSNRHNRASVGMYIAPEFRKRGYAAMAMSIAVNYACKFLGMEQVTAEVAADNTASIRMLEQCGFTICGTMRSWLRRGRTFADAVLMQHLA